MPTKSGVSSLVKKLHKVSEAKDRIKGFIPGDVSGVLDSVQNALPAEVGGILSKAQSVVGNDDQQYSTVNRKRLSTKSTKAPAPPNLIDLQHVSSSIVEDKPGPSSRRSKSAKTSNPKQDGKSFRGAQRSAPEFRGDAEIDLDLEGENDDVFNIETASAQTRQRPTGSTISPKHHRNGQDIAQAASASRKIAGKTAKVTTVADDTTVCNEAADQVVNMIGAVVGNSARKDLGGESKSQITAVAAIAAITTIASMVLLADQS